MFKPLLIIAGISTRSSVGQSILTVQAEDQDSVGMVEYSITSADVNTNNVLQIDRTSGIITNRVLMDPYAGQTLSLTASAADGQLSATASVLVSITFAGWTLYAQPMVSCQHFNSNFAFTLVPLKLKWQDFITQYVDVTYFSMQDFNISYILAGNSVLSKSVPKRTG